MKALKSQANIERFNTKVGFGVATLKASTKQYMLTPKNGNVEDMLHSECANEKPHNLLTILNHLVAENMFLKHAELNNFRFNEVEAFRLKIMHAANQLGFSHVLCRKLSGNEGINKTDPMLKFVVSLVKNITVTVEKQLKIVDNTYFPSYVKRAVQLRISELHLTGSLKERNHQIAHSISHMLVHYYSYGFFTTLNTPLLRNNAYTVYVSQKRIAGKLPKQCVVYFSFTDVNHDTYYVTIYRSAVPQESHENKHNVLVTELKSSCSNLEIESACSDFEFCGIVNYDKNGAAYGQNNFEYSVEMLCDHMFTVMTGLPYGAPIVEQSSEPGYVEPDFLEFMEQV
uniref:TC1 domain-containing protein n=1 Tax=Panagrellus redivivus TaxID=6233 RepID=A0A7E4VPT7_PANRE